MQSTPSVTSSDKRTVPSFCRNCTAYCPIMVTVENGRAVKVAGDFEAPAYDGYTCPKGRDIPAQHNYPQRPLHCLARQDNGQLAPIPSDTLLDEVASRIQDIARHHGPRSVAVFYGTGNVTNPAGSAMARALDYRLKRWGALTRFLDDGQLPIDNNWAENQIRPIAIGRKNWLFAGSLRAGQRAAAVMSLIQSARLNGHDPYAYLKDVLQRLPTHKNHLIAELLPHRWQPLHS